MRKLPLLVILIILAGLALITGLAFLNYNTSLQSRISWRADRAFTYLRGVINPVGELPTVLPQPHVAVTAAVPDRAMQSAAMSGSSPLDPTVPAIASSGATPTTGPTSTPTPMPTPIPGAIALNPPKWEKQDANNCGPASLALYLRFYGWGGDQFTISKVIKPFREDRNVNVDELVYFVRNKAGWLNIEYRVGGDVDTLKRLLAAGFPVMIEEGMALDQTYWPNDDKWAAHYMLLTGYDDAAQTFTGQDTYYGPDKKFPYKTLDQYWKAFDRVYIMLYPPDQETTIQSILGPRWDADYSRQLAQQTAQQEIQANPNDAFAWFNLGTNQAYFDQYSQAAESYDHARNIGLPQRMLRYQFGPFMAYFNSGQLDQLETIINYALKITPNSEEAFLWRGWLHFRQGDKVAAIADFQQALKDNPSYADAQYALRYVSGSS